MAKSAGFSTHYGYKAPIDALLHAGVLDYHTRLEDMAGAEFSRAEIPELIRMATDPLLLWLAPEPQAWAPVHAWFELARLRAVEAIEPLIALFDDLDDEESDEIQAAIPRILGTLGAKSLPPLRRYLVNPVKPEYGRIAAAQAIAQNGLKHPECRDETIALLVEALNRHNDAPKGLNGFIVYSLAQLNGVEAAGSIREAFAAERVDCAIIGDWEDVQIRFGLLSERVTPRRDYLAEYRRDIAAQEKIERNRAKRERKKRKKKR